LQDSEYLLAFKDVFAALRYKVGYLPAWKLMARILVTAIERQSLAGIHR